MADPLKIDRVKLENFRSIARCEVELGRLTFFVGANDSGKTNFLDALEFIESGLNQSLTQALEVRGGLESLVYLPNLRAPLAIGIEMSSLAGQRASYSVRMQAPDVLEESCNVVSDDGVRSSFAVNDGVVTGTESVFPAIAAERLFLVNASGLPPFRPVYDCLSALTFLEPAPRGIYDLAQSQGHSNTLSHRFDNLAKDHPVTKRVIEDYLRAVAPQFDRLDVSTLANFKFLRFIEKPSNGYGETSFGLNQVSTGLLNAAAMLLELFEPPKEGRPWSLVALEEPEAFLHPSAVQVMRDAFLEASETRQILITSHSPDLLDDPSIPGEWIRVVYRDGVETRIEPLGESTRSIIRDRLFTAGELMRQGGLKN